MISLKYLPVFWKTDYMGFVQELCHNVFPLFHMLNITAGKRTAAQNVVYANAS